MTNLLCPGTFLLASGWIMVGVRRVTCQSSLQHDFKYYIGTSSFAIIYNISKPQVSLIDWQESSSYITRPTCLRGLVQFRVDKTFKWFKFIELKGETFFAPLRISFQYVCDPDPLPLLKGARKEMSHVPHTLHIRPLHRSISIMHVDISMTYIG